MKQNQNAGVRTSFNTTRSPTDNACGEGGEAENEPRQKEYSGNSPSNASKWICPRCGNTNFYGEGQVRCGGCGL